MSFATVTTPVDDLAILVWAELHEAGDTGVATWELRRRLPELSKYQVKRGLDRINHVLQETREQPLVHFNERGRGVVYKLPEHCPDYRAFAIRRLRELVTRAHTELTRAQAAILRWPDELAVYLPKMLDRVVEDLEYIVADMGEIDGEG